MSQQSCHDPEGQELNVESMRRVSLRARVAGVVVLATVMAAPLAVAAAPAAPKPTATVTVLHAIPEGLGADVVDVYAGRTLLIDNLSSGQAQSTTMPGGTYDIQILGNGRKPGSSAPLLRAPRARIPAGGNVTLTANLTASGKPALTQFTNNTRTVGMDMGRLTIRHIAAAPPVDIRLNGQAVIDDLRNGRQGDVGLRSGTYSVSIVKAGTKVRIAKSLPVTIVNKPGRSHMGNNTIVYVWGSAADGTVQQAVQNVRLEAVS